MFASVLSAVILGMDVYPVRVEADMSEGLPSFTMVGFPSAQVKEAQDRVRTALRNNQFRLPPRRITVNFAPADIKKEGAGFDLPVAAAVLAAAGMLSLSALKGVLMVGELSLNGEILPVSGVLPRVLKARELGCRFCVIPYENLREGKLVPDMRVIGVRTLKETLNVLKEPEQAFLQPNREPDFEGAPAIREKPDFQDICGQEGARRAVEIAVCGFHNLLLLGPPGSGKTMMARRVSTIMPGLSYEEKLELTKIYSIAGLLLGNAPLLEERPFRSPHHTSSAQALAGGGKNPRPGEITLAHRGVLFLDEMPEFSRRSLEILRQPLEDKKIYLSRASGTYQFPASFMLVAAMNPCPCGYFPDMERCHCTPGEISHYLGKISQPLLDRMDICTEVPPVEFCQMKSAKKGESSQIIRIRVEKAREIQKQRYQGEGFLFNSELTGEGVKRHCVLTSEGEALLEQAYKSLKFSARGFHRILKVARTIADMDGKEKIHGSHVAEAVSYRSLDKKYWNVI